MSGFRMTTLSTLSLCSFVIMWAIAAGSIGRPDLVPSPLQVVEALKGMLSSGEIVKATITSLGRVVVGYLLGGVAGVVTGIILGRITIIRESFSIIFDVAKGIPPIALVPVVIMWFGIGEMSKWLVIAYVVWVVVTISTLVGAKEVPLIRLRTAEIIGLGPLERLYRVVLPSVVPYALIGLRNAVGFAFVALVSAELIGANSGLGQIIMDSRFALQTDRMVVGIFVLGGVGAICQILFELMERLILARRFQTG
ncbi:ABC transporter permease [Aminobacter ciceronei]|jgi:NitT/TauT family transport system permease protein|uniref:ABC-type nitrate/sulfonate/bicarbonate transport system permease component n=1 Tax=Aminobacter ciceronei TaxID=150723 RepID=A0ABR6C7X6_9HYPH|nr:ABC transporter permease [Aminobacter ciceronei]MBA8906783.1 ABC-type nitrate/sulfonate/bicarbonate transport system permease component [Aminobacter ciceronei]MBA9020562.1 ABC-type nitrate/sulfonate/bicarbonate transport system permease component [Aminobacter ciceronei]